MPKWVACLVLLLAGCSSGGSHQLVGLGYTPYSHEHEPFAHELWNEQTPGIKSAPDPQIGQVLVDSSQRYVHVSGGARRSWEPPTHKKVVWFFGASSLFGIGQRDEHTIPSEVARLSAAAGQPIEVVNFGLPGYVEWQELILYRRTLAQRPAPDLVVFYDGINDMALVCREINAGLPPDANGDLAGKKRPLKGVNCFDHPDRVGRAVGAELTEQRNGLPEVLWLWQPTLEAKKSVPSDAPIDKRLGITPEARRLWQQANRVALATTSPPSVDLSHALDNAGGPTFFDWAHTNELGARLVAKAAWPAIQKRLFAAVP